MASLALKIIIGYFDIADLQLESSVGFPEGGNFFLQVVLGGSAFRLRLFVFGLREDIELGM
jgi:hypothetical protein